MELRDFYWLRVAERAFKETVDLADWKPKSAAFGALLLLSGAFLTWYLEGEMSEELSSLRSPVYWGSLLLAFGALFFWKFVGIPARMFAELQHQVREDWGSFYQIERQIPELIQEMADDLQEKPLVRRFVLVKRGWSVVGDGEDSFVYWFDEHENLRSKIRILEEAGFVRDISTGKLEMFVMSGDFVSCLRSRSEL